MPRGECAICHRAGHRYGTTDPEHKFNAMGCVNSLLPVVDRYRAALEQIASNRFPKNCREGIAFNRDAARRALLTKEG